MDDSVAVLRVVDVHAPDSWKEQQKIFTAYREAAMSDQFETCKEFLKVTGYYTNIPFDMERLRYGRLSGAIQGLSRGKKL